MKTHRGGEAVTKGVYLNLSTFELNQVYGEPPVLPENGKARYLRLPALLAVLGGPIAGLVFIIFLPLIGIVGAAAVIIYKLEKMAVAAGRKALHPRAGTPEVSHAYHAATDSPAPPEATDQPGGENGQKGHQGD